MDARAALNDHWTGGAKSVKIRIGVNDGFYVANGGIAQARHGNVPDPVSGHIGGEFGGNMGAMAAPVKTNDTDG
tara:strand:- start:83110 stop:83331 length:222 start_codon:yes stop_codon:yes gene_type:complete